jgi:uncharacterized RDD family membrane protein YckC
MEADSRSHSPDDDFEAGLQGYSKEDLISILNSIDREKFPGRYAMAQRRYLEITGDPALSGSGREDRFHTGWRRFFALILDAVFLAIAGFLILYPLSMFGHLMSFGSGILDHLLGPLYGVIAVWKFGKTLGKHICGVEVVTWPDERKAGLREALLREAFPLVLLGLTLVTWALPQDSRGIWPLISGAAAYAVGIGSFAWVILEIVTMLLDPQRRALHDKIAGTVVIKRGR